MFCFFLLLAGFQLKHRVKPISAPLSSSIPKTVSLDQMQPIYMLGCNVSQIGGQIFFFFFFFLLFSFYTFQRVAAVKL